MRLSIAISSLFSFKIANAFTVHTGLTSCSLPAKQTVALASSNDGWYDDYDEFAKKLDFNDGGWDNNPSSSDRPRGGGNNNYSRSSGRSFNNDYSRDPTDTSPVNEQLINSMLSERTEMRRKGMFDEADNIRNELLSVHGVTVWDKDRVWTTKAGAGAGGARGGGRGDRGARGGRGGRRDGGRIGRGSGRGRGKERRFNEHGHDYNMAGGPIDRSVCSLPEREIHMLIRERMECKFDRNYDMADSIQRELLSYGVAVHDGYKEWRADGESWGTFDSFRALTKGPRGPKVYTRRGPGAGLTDEEIETIDQMVADRSEAKNIGDYDKADAIFAELGSRFNVNVDDRAAQWALRHEEYEMSSYSAIVPELDVMKIIGNKLADRISARKNRDFALADQIRQELEEEYLVRVDDQKKEWRIVQPDGAKWADDEDEAGEFAGMNFESKAEFDEDFDEDDVDDDDDEKAIRDSTDAEDLSSLTVPQLKAKLKEAGLPVSGVKAELIERLSTV